jgi:hypothetical protein
MSLKLVYLLVFIFSGSASLSAISRGAWFRIPLVKFTLLVFAIIVLIASCIFVAVMYTWLHIFGLIALAMLTIWTVPYIWVVLLKQKIDY